MLLSKYILDWEGFANCPIIGHGYKTSWEESYLRIWLNNNFLKESFSAEEQELILPVSNPSSLQNGECTVDRAFLLSADEAKRYFPKEADAIALEPMIFAASRTGDKDSPIELSYSRSIWWTRTSGTTKALVVCVDWQGALCEEDSNCDETGVRPAVWVRL